MPGRRALVFALACSSLMAQNSKAPAADWPTFNRDPAATRYSPLTQVDTRNVTKLAQAWTYRVKMAGARGPASEVTPIVVGA
jgi:glucose dehydrogenase